ncbi:uncharacterized protein required for cytochrome oxidase assembly [Anaerolinea thermolimosa]|uniref:COX15/CtaA family protein n=1 Tax=Anaerolinea thermolimosa TaxID=229919 RepID=UPI000A03D215|nr:COX15/CtaA family protein [Anaerolinea thermolimosa]GAP06459.1 uncharacterized protein required for cytochrome oxidase assembly [Anaerolinea thermolimosa]
MENTISNSLKRFSWFVLVYNLLVIVFGAYVRATRSGAGCGSHWPLCNGVVIPQNPATETIVEFTHRVTSGFTVLLIVILITWIWRRSQRGSPIRVSAALAGFFIITESLIGAGLVLFELVAHNDSMARAFSMMAHLVNTFLLIASIGITSWWLSFGAPQKAPKDRQARLLSLLGAGGMLFLGASGAVTALGDTLFPVSSLAEGLQQDFDTTAHILLRLRVFHPVIAILAGGYLIGFGIWLRSRYPWKFVKQLGNWMIFLIVLQWGLGLLNVVLLAPVWLQLVHLSITTLIWLLFVGLSIFAWIPFEFSSGIGHNPVHDAVNQSSARESSQMKI